MRSSHVTTQSLYLHNQVDLNNKIHIYLMEQKLSPRAKKFELNLNEGETYFKGYQAQTMTPQTMESMSNITRLQHLQILKSVDRRQLFLSEKAPAKTTVATDNSVKEKNAPIDDTQICTHQSVCQIPQLKQYQKQKILEHLVLQEDVFEWKKIAQRLNCTRDEAIELWQSKIHPKFLLHSKVAGSQRWARQEDTIVFRYGKLNGLDENALLLFLPNRSSCSIEGRWRRLLKNDNFIQKQEIQGKKAHRQDPSKSMCKYELQKYILRKIGARAQQSQRGQCMKEE